MHIHRNRISSCRAGAIALAFTTVASALGAGETITVTTAEDIIDFGGAQQAGDLPGPDGVVSFNEACAAANNTPGGQTIAFAIPQSEWMFPNMATIKQETTTNAFFLNDDSTIVDFTTQTAFSGDTNPDGPEVSIFGLHPNNLGIASIYLNGDNCVIKGLGPVQQRGYAVRIVGNNNRVIGCAITGPVHAAVYINGYVGSPAPTGNIVGGTEEGEGNFLSAGNTGVRIDGPAAGNIVIGNTLRGVYWGAEIRSPTCCPGNDAVNNRIGGPTPAERNIISGSGRFGEEGFPTGGQVKVEYSPNNIVEGNYIGTTADGNAVHPGGQRGPVGVEVRSSIGTVVRNNVVGGILAIGVNHAAGQRFGVGVAVMGKCDGTVIQGNRIGVGADGVSPLANRAGLSATYWSVNGMPVTIGPIQVGGSGAAQANIIANSELAGVSVASQVTGVRLSGNSIFANAGLGIDLFGSSGVTPNDPGDGDVGGNMLQNFPILTTATSSAGGTQISGTLNSTPNTAFTIEFFSNSACDPSGYGEGEVFIGSTSVTTDAQGNASFTTIVPTTEAAGRQITATATNPQGNTSEFAACAPVMAGITPGDTNADGQVNVDDLLAVITGWGTCPVGGPPEPCAADLNADGQVNVDDLLMVITNWNA